MLMPVHNLPIEEAQALDHLSDDDFFARFPDVTHRVRPWAPCLVVEEGWVIYSRRDGFRMRVRQHLAPVQWTEKVILAQPSDESDLSFDHAPFGGIVGAVRHAR